MACISNDMIVQLTKSISTGICSVCNTKGLAVLLMLHLGYASTGAQQRACFNCLKAALQFAIHSNVTPFCVKVVNGAAIIENWGI